jgi:hypothetical protein
MTIAVAHLDRGTGHAVLDAVRERRPPFSPDQCVNEFAGLLQSYGVHKVTGDRYAGEWPRESFRKYGIAYEPSELRPPWRHLTGKPRCVLTVPQWAAGFTDREDRNERSKSEIYIETLPLLNAGRVELLDHPRLVAQLCSLERRTARGGRDSIDHPPHSHDDVANAVAGALVLAGAKVSWFSIEGADGKRRAQILRDVPGCAQDRGRDAAAGSISIYAADFVGGRSECIGDVP